MRISGIVVLLTFSLLACTIAQTNNVSPAQELPPSNVQPAVAVGQTPIWNCEEPRPTRCGTENEPVCGSDVSEYRNSCYACRNDAVVGYTEGPCV